MTEMEKARERNKDQLITVGLENVDNEEDDETIFSSDLINSNPLIVKFS
jgi:hypothetical protein